MRNRLNTFDNLKKCIHPLLLKIVSGRRKFSIRMINQMPQIEGNKIFVMNHSNVYDAPIACETIKEHFYVLVGKQRLEFIDRLFFRLNGVVYIDRKSKESKKRGFSRMIKILRRGNNLLIYPEGTWNMTPSKPMLPLNWGVIELAREIGIPIVPLIAEYHTDCCYINFGKAIFVDADCDKALEIKHLEDGMATLRWEIWEQFPVEKRNENMKAEFEQMIAGRIQEYPKFNLAYENSVVRERM